MIQVNVMALTALTHLYADNMSANGGGHILNVASLAGWMAIPNQNVYAASKAYVVSFSQALSNEMTAANSGVQVTALCPGYTATKMMDNPDQGATLRIPSSMMMSAKDVAEIGIKACFAGKDMVVPGLANKFTTHHYASLFKVINNKDFRFFL
jgi:short-subunit dehydrogenase